MALLTVEHLNFTYPEAETASVCDLSFSLEKGTFAVLCGETGSGKSTLLRLLKRELSPKGLQSGRILWEGKELASLSPSDAACRIGFVMQDPEAQIVTDTVWHELAFGLENLGIPQETIAKRIAEMASYFGMEAWFERRTDELSGGQKQLLNLAAVMVTDPDLLILDEPTAQMDPIAAADFIATLQKLNRELSLTILLTEHRLEEVLPICDRMLWMQNGRLISNEAPRRVIAKIPSQDPLWEAMPAACRLHRALEDSSEAPLTVREGRQWLETQFDCRVRTLPPMPQKKSRKAALELRDVYFRYTKNGADILRGTDLTVYEGEIFCLLGGNGAGKSTALGVCAGLYRAYHGKISLFEQPLKAYKGQALYRNCLALLPQDVQTAFLRNTVAQELADANAQALAQPFGLTALADRHPYDLSGGEQQLLALAKVLAQQPRLLLLDEPTKGLDAGRKQRLIEILRRLQAEGVTVLAVTHDVEFAAACADRCGLFFGGKTVFCGTPQAFFGDNHFYTTAIARMTKGYYTNCVTVSQAAELCRQNQRDTEVAP